MTTTTALRPEAASEIQDKGRSARRRGPFARAYSREYEDAFESKRRASRAGGKRSIGETPAKPEPMSEADKEKVADIKRRVDLLASGPGGVFEGL